MSKSVKYVDSISDMREELKVCVIGSVDAGKSSLISVLVYEALDDGRGFARKKYLDIPTKERQEELRLFHRITYEKRKGV